MKSILSVSISSELLSEVQGLGLERGEMSALVEQALKDKLHKPLTEQDLVVQKEEKLSELKVKVNQKSQLYPERFKKCVRYAKYCLIPSTTTDEKIAFWERVLEDMKKEISPAPPKEKVLP